jgi:hypothetical protein
MVCIVRTDDQLRVSSATQTTPAALGKNSLRDFSSYESSQSKSSATQ